jgi:hypothetical protein
MAISHQETTTFVRDLMKVPTRFQPKGHPRRNLR